MPVAGPISEQVLTLVAAATVFAVMFDLGLGIVPREFRWVLQNTGLLLRGLFAVLVAVPVLALALVRVFDLPRGVEIGIVLMAISPGAPIALRRSLDAGAHRALAQALQILVATLAVVSMPLSIAALNHFYSGQASLDPRQVAWQVFIAQLLPLGIGIAIRQFAPGFTTKHEPRVKRLATLLLVVLLVMVMLDIAPVILATRTGAAMAIVALTVLAALTATRSAAHTRPRARP